ncbi:MAG: Ig domain protein group 1 domain protein [Chloroflexi bacterium]|nr:Ig domain protein group 1 domain protein [Chloroflexota bacterium]
MNIVGPMTGGRFGHSLLALTLLVMCAGLRPDRVAATQAGVGSSSGKVYWLRVDPAQPKVLFAGVTGDLIKRSSDGGATWQYISAGNPRGDYAESCGDSAAPPVIALGGHDLYTRYTQSTDPVCRTGIDGWLQSRDGGSTYTNLGAATDYQLAAPIVSARLYAISGSNGGNYLAPPTCTNTVESRGPANTAWHKRGTVPVGGKINPLSADQACFDLVDDPQHPNTLFANTNPMVRSEDGGLTWTAIITPTTTPALDTFAVRYDPAAGGLLEGFSHDAGVPKDRVFLSSDAGRTWTAAPCPGDHQGHCPSITLHDVFGAGANYAVFPDGVYAFLGAGPAGARLTLSTAWPFSTAQIKDMQGTGRSAYALLKDGALWASSDRGHSWRLQVDAGNLPTRKPATPPSASRAAGPYGHVVGLPFSATYRALGPYILGYPLDEPYVYRNVLTQDFEHLRLQWRGGKVVTDALGSEATAYIGCGMGSDRPDGYCQQHFRRPARPNSTTSLYFPATGHTLSGDLLRFWRAHGGQAVLGMPISEVYRARNGDGTTRMYAMQLFTNARLERHPELHNPRYAVLLGLLGVQVLQYHGWLPGTPANPSAS